MRLKETKEQKHNRHLMLKVAGLALIAAIPTAVPKFVEIYHVDQAATESLELTGQIASLAGRLASNGTYSVTNKDDSVRGEPQIETSYYSRSRGQKINETRLTVWHFSDWFADSLSRGIPTDDKQGTMYSLTKFDSQGQGTTSVIIYSYDAPVATDELQTKIDYRLPDGTEVEFSNRDYGRASKDIRSVDIKAGIAATRDLMDDFKQ